jgi:hypothetical protein
MARLVLSLDGQVMAEYNMNKERYTIGRLPDNDIRIDNAAVSGHHSLIINILNDSFLEDLNSTNGTYVNGKLIKKHALQHGDVITVGHHQLRFVEDDEQQDEFEKTMVIQPSARPLDKLRTAAEVAEKAGPSISATGKSRALDGAAAIKKAKLQVLSGAFAGREVELSKALTTLGRPGIQVAAITRRAEAYYIVHVDSGKPDDYPLLNGTPIGAQATKLNDNDVIQLAGVKMGFFVNLGSRAAAAAAAAATLAFARRIGVVHVKIRPLSVRLEWHPLAHAAKQLVGNSASVARDLLDWQARAPEGSRAADLDALDAGNVHGDHIHRHASHQRRPLTLNQHRRAAGEAAV